MGNTTAAVGKGFAIGSAAFATVSLIVSYVGNYSSEMMLNIASFVVVSGAIIGGAIGGVPGAIIGLLAGATLGVLASETLFNHDGVLSKDEVVKLIIPALGAIVGGVIGFKAGPEGALLGASIGFAATLLLEKLIFQENDVGQTFWHGYNSPIDYFVSEVLGWPSDQEIATWFNNQKTLLLLKWDKFRNELSGTFKEGGWLDNAWEELTTSLSDGWEAFMNDPTISKIADFFSNPLGTIDDAISSSPIAGWIDNIKKSFADGVNSLIDIWNAFMDKLAGADLSFTIFGKEFNLNNVINFDNWKLEPIEIQAEAHYALPVRNMLYDAMSYAQQVADIATEHRKNKDKMTSEEFLSGLKKEDKLMPVITLVISLSAETWDGPLTLHEMLAVENKELLTFVPDYRLNLLSPDKIEDFGKFRTELGVLFECIKHKQDDNMDWMEGKEHFRHVNRNTAILIKTVTGFDISLDEERDVVDMMNAWENGLNQARNDAFLAGKDEGRDSTIVTTIRNLMETSGWDARQTMEAMKIPVKEQEKYAKQI